MTHPNPPGPDLPPESPELTDYDRAHLKEYLMILDGVAAGATWQDIMRHVFKADPDVDPQAKHRYEAFLARASWMTQVGYRLLDAQSASFADRRVPNPSKRQN